ncbi:hypothetical protein EXE58_04310 [Nocardioides seonyuensis]|uniref:FHA domain-containing protein n=1 Tax=Nocardioides seonyuensis TaxID=2518371 RepID=A0A4P7IFK0_9ACTN|nr:hypothetical protein [Nocardioides seonyuensis]QBX54767.1 hypothetical protein EXE58_04310 [Nocardioides seonyuensis]
MSAPARDRRFSPGEWYAVCGEAVTLVLPPSARSRVAALWELADGGAGADELLDAVVAGGVRTLSDLAMVSESDGAARVLVRGAVTALVSTPGSEVTVAAVPGTTWNEQLITGATGVRLQVADGASALVDSSLTSGIARISVVEVGACNAASGVEAAEEEPEQQHVTDGPHSSEPAEPSPRAEEHVPVVSPAPVVESEPVVASAPVEEPSPAGEPAPVDEPHPHDDLSDRDGETRAGAPAQEFTRPPVPGQEVAPAVLSRPVAKLVFSTGDVVDVDRVILAGRAPEARRFASHDQPRLLTLPSPNQEISSTHLEVRPGAGADHGMAIVTDLGSTNGTVLMQPGLPPEDLRPGIAVSLVPGAVLDLGDGVTIQVTNP